MTWLSTHFQPHFLTLPTCVLGYNRVKLLDYAYFLGPAHYLWDVVFPRQNQILWFFCSHSILKYIPLGHGLSIIFNIVNVYPFL